MSTTINLLDSYKKSNHIRYTPEFINAIANSISTELSLDIINNLLEIKQNNKFIKKRSPIKLKYVMKTNTANIWRNEKIENNISDEIKFTEQINGNLNKLSNNNYSIIENEIKNLIKDKEEKYIYIIIDCLFSKSILEKSFTNLYGKLSLIFIEIYGEKFKEIILDKIKNFYNNQIKLFKNNENNLEKLDYNDLCKKNKEKQQFIGIFNLIGSLYQNDIINKDIIIEYLNFLLESSLDLESNDNTMIEKYIECIITLLNNIGKKLEQELGNNNFENIVLNKLEKIKMDKNNYKPRIRFIIMDFFDFKNNNWNIKI